MADITAAMVKVLRERTGAGMMECKKALVETQGNIELAIDKISQSGKLHAANKAGRIAAEGIILTQIAQNGKYGVIIELNCETDFVAKDNVFSNFGAAVITTALTERISDLELLKDKCEDQRIALVSKIGENINIRRLGVMEGNSLGSYLHCARIGVIVAADGANEELRKHIAMHIAASKPEYVNKADIPADVVAREHQRQLEIAISSGKTLEIAEKIVAGRMLKFTGEIALTGQHFVMDPSKTVGKLLEEHNAQVTSFIRFELGEGIEKATVNFTADISAMDAQM